MSGGEPITEVDLEMNEGTGVFAWANNVIKTRPDNTVIVHQAKMYSRAEMLLAFEVGRNFQLTGENNLNEIL